MIYYGSGLAKLQLGCLILVVVSWSEQVYVASDHIEQIGFEDQSAWITCPGINPNSVTWSRTGAVGGAPIGSANNGIQVLPNNTLYIALVEIYHEGLYVCNDRLSWINGTVDFRVHVRPPFLSMVGLPKSVSAGQRVNITCTAARIRPRPSDIFWSIRSAEDRRLIGTTDEILLDGHQGVYSISSTLAITLTEEDLNQNLICNIKPLKGPFIRHELPLSPCYGNFTRISNMASLGGTLVPVSNGVTTEKLCIAHCEAREAKACDFNFCNKRCYMHDGLFPENAINYAVGTVQYRQTGCGAHRRNTIIEKYTTLAKNAISLSSMSFTLKAAKLSEGETLQAECSGLVLSWSDPPEGVFFQFEDDPSNLLVSEAYRVPGDRMSAVLKYQVHKHDDDRSLRCIMVSGGKVFATESRKIKVCYDGVLKVESLRSPSGSLQKTHIQQNEICRIDCENDPDCAAVDYEVCTSQCFTHVKTNVLISASEAYEVDSFRKSTCTPTGAKDEHASTGASKLDIFEDLTSPKFIAFIIICGLLLIIVIILVLVCIYWFRKYKYASPPPRYKDNSSKPSVQPIRATHTLSREYRKQRLGLYADPLTRYSSGFISPITSDTQSLTARSDTSRMSQTLPRSNGVKPKHDDSYEMRRSFTEPEDKRFSTII